MTARFLSILALSAALLLPGCLQDVDAPGADDAAFEKAQTDAAGVDNLTFEFSGAFTATPATPVTEDFPFEVPKGAVGIAATLEWSDPVAAYRLELVDPRGDPQGRGFPEASGRASTATVEPPRSGEWVVRVSSSRALEAPFTLDVAVSFLVPEDNVLSDTVALRAGDFVELNLIMEGNATFAWEYASTGDVSWDIHSHEDGKTITHEEGSGTSHSATFTAPKRQIYSILFVGGAAPVELSYKVEGAFRVHSHSQ